MPLLKRGTEIFPQELFSLPEDASPWWVAHTRSRQEKNLARYLEPLDIPFYLPHWEKRVERGGRQFVSYLPLFPGYVFFRGGAAEHRAAQNSRLLARILQVPDQGRLRDELLQLRELQARGASLIPLPEFFPGDRIRVADGPFRGYFGTVLRAQTRLRLVVSLSMLGSYVAVEFDRESLSLALEAPRGRGESVSAVA